MTTPLRNDWKESLLKDIELCERNGSRGDADTLDDAATSLETISRIAGRDKDMLGMMDVRLYAAARAKAAREAQAAQPEGGA